jgi:hypothetical protein
MINLVKADMPKMLTGMSQNGAWVAFGVFPTKAWTSTHRGRIGT